MFTTLFGLVLQSKLKREKNFNALSTSTTLMKKRRYLENHTLFTLKNYSEPREGHAFDKIMLRKCLARICINFFASFEKKII